MFIELFTFKGVLSMEEHKKLYKAGKLWLAMTIFAFAAGLTMSSPIAHAADNQAQTNVAMATASAANTPVTSATPASQSTARTIVTNPQAPASPASSATSVSQSAAASSNQAVSSQAVTNSVLAGTTKVHAATVASEASDPYQNVIQLPSGWVDALRSEHGWGDITDSTLSNTLSTLGIDGEALNSGKYIHNPNDNYVVNYNADGSIDKRQILILTQYVCRLLNPIREALGNPVYQINQGSIDIVDEVAKGYVQDNWNLLIKRAHDMSRLQKIGGDYGVIVSESISAGYTQAAPRQNTMDQLKNAAYDSIVDMLFQDADSEWGHTTDLVGARVADVTSTFLGVAPDSLGNLHYNGEPQTNGIWRYELTDANQNAYKMVTDNEGTSKFNQEYHFTYDVNQTTFDPNTPIALDNKANLDSYQLLPGQDSAHAILKVTGWHAADLSHYNSNPYLIVYDNTLGHEVARQRITSTVSRPDVYRAYPYIYNSQNSGFDQEISIPVSSLGHSLSVVARFSNNATTGEGATTDYWFSPISFDQGNYASLDAMAIQNGKLHVAGWHASNQAANRPYHVVILYDASQGCEITRQTVNPSANQRADVAKVYPTIANALVAGFNLDFDLTPAMTNDNLQIISRWSMTPDANSNYTDYWFSARRVVTDTGNYASLDSISTADNKVTVRGWNASNQDFGRSYHYIIAFDKTTNKEISRVLIQDHRQRDDVMRVYPQVFNADQSGFQASFNLTPSMVNDNIAYISRWTDDPAGNGNAVDYWFNPVNKIDRGHLDNCTYNNDQLTISGWHANDASIYKPYRTLILYDLTANREVSRQNVAAVSRPDVARAFNDTHTAGNSGFNAVFTGFTPVLGHQYSLVSRYSLTADANHNYTDHWFSLGTLA